MEHLVGMINVNIFSRFFFSIFDFFRFLLNSDVIFSAFLPHILDCQSKCQNGHIKMLEKLGDKYKKQGWGWLWSEGAQQTKLEESLDVGGFGYPALAVVSAKKMKYSTLTGSFGFDGINKFLWDLSYRKGRASLVKGAKIPKIYDIDA